MKSRRCRLFFVIDFSDALGKLFEHVFVGNFDAVAVVGDAAGAAERENDFVGGDAVHAQKAGDVRHATKAREAQFAVDFFCTFEDKARHTRCGLAFLLGDKVVYKSGILVEQAMQEFLHDLGMAIKKVIKFF